MVTSIIILTMNKLEYTKMCIESIRKYTDYGTYELIVVDNNSTDGTVEWLKEQKDIKSIFNESNLGFPKGCNQGIEIAMGDNILLLNNDTVVTNHWLENLINCLYSSDDIGAVGPVTNNCSYYQTIHVNYMSIEEMFQFGANYNNTKVPVWEERIKLIGFCMLIKRGVVDKVGQLDELFTPGNYEDDDYSYRIMKAGYKLILCKNTFIHHFGSTSFKDNISHFQTLLKENEKKFEVKWGFNPNYSSNIRLDIIDMIDDPIEREIHVLEVGCACGATLLKIKNQYKNAKLYGIELNENSAGIAKFFADVKAENVENSLSYPNHYFDYVIFGDVLEHLYNPWDVVRNIRNYLKPDGKLLVSIPNVMHFSLIRDLINGHWTYQDAGLLDRTHVRFFTLSELNKMFKEAGYPKLEYRMTTIPKTEEDEHFINQLCSLTNKELVNQYNAYQYLIKASKEEIQIEVDRDRQLTYLIRRIENEIEREESVKQLVAQLKEGIISHNDILNVIHKDIIAKEQNLNFLASVCYQNELYESVIPFLQASIILNPQNMDTLYNLGFTLYRFGEPKMALNFLEKIIDKDNEILELILDIKGEINDEER